MCEDTVHGVIVGALVQRMASQWDHRTCCSPFSSAQTVMLDLGHGVSGSSLVQNRDELLIGNLISAAQCASVLYFDQVVSC